MQGKAPLEALIIRRDLLLDPKPVVDEGLAVFEALKDSRSGKGCGLLGS